MTRSAESSIRGPDLSLGGKVNILGQHRMWGASHTVSSWGRQEMLGRDLLGVRQFLSPAQDGKQ